MSEENKKHYIEITLKTVLEDVMGKSIDMVRVTEVSDRALEQYEKTLKKYIYNMLQVILDDFRKRGYLPAETVIESPTKGTDAIQRKIIGEEIKKC